MIQSLVNVPTTENDWLIWGFAHSQHHAEIRQAVQSKNGTILVDYEIYPIDPQFIESFLQKNQQLHDDMNAIVGTQSSNLQEVDLIDKSQLESWIWLHFQEHRNVATILGI